MPWSVSDVDSHHKGLTDKQKRMWVAVANRCLGAGDDDATAIKKANAAVNKVVEAASVLGDSMGGDLVEAASRLLMDNSHSGIRDKLYKALQLLDHRYPWISDVFGNEKSGTVVFRVDSKYYQRSYEKAGDDYTMGEEKAVTRAYVPVKEADVIEFPESAQLEETIFQTRPIMLLERAVAADGTFPIKIIAPGHGTTGYYPADVLKRDGPKIFAEGCKMYWDHDTEEEANVRPEGTLTRLAAVLTENAKWVEDHPDGPGLYARAKAFKAFKEDIEELAPYIGVSIRGFGEAVNGQVGGKPTKIIRSIKGAHSVDFVTAAGAGGRIVQMFEAARSRELNQESQSMTKEEQEQLQESQRKVTDLQTQVRRLQEAATLRDGADIMRAEVAQARNLPDLSRTKLLESAGTCIKTKQDGTLDTEATRAAAKALVEAEVKYVSSLLGTGAVVGMGEATGTGTEKTEEQVNKELRESLQALGIPEAGLDAATKGVF